jgi:hypothetical protein
LRLNKRPRSSRLGLPQTRLIPRKLIFGLVLITTSLLAVVSSGQSLLVEATQMGTATVTIVPTSSSGGGSPGSTTTSSTSSTSSEPASSMMITKASCSFSCTASAIDADIGGRPQTYNFNTSIRDESSSTDINQVVVYLFNPGGGAKGIWDRQRSYAFRWVRNSWSGNAGAPCSTPQGCFQELLSSGWSDTLVNLQAFSTHSAIGGGGSSCGITGQGDCVFSFAFTFNWGDGQENLMPQYTADHSWNFEVDWENLAGVIASRTENFDVNLYANVLVPSSISWGTVSSGWNAKLVGATNMTWSSNANFQMMIAAHGLNADDPANIYNQYGDSMPMSNVFVCQTSQYTSCNGTNGFSLHTWPQQLYTIQGAVSKANKIVYWYLTTPTTLPPGTYAFQYIVYYANPTQPT